MRLRLILAGVLAVAPGSVFAQEWTEFASISTTTWTSEYGAELPARIYLAAGPLPAVARMA